MLKRFLIFLTLVSIVCGAFYLSSPKNPVERAEPVWPVLNKDQVDRLDVCSLGEECFSLVRRTDGWGVVQHGWSETVEADLKKVNSLLDVLAQDKALRFMGRVSEPVPAEYGFESPRMRIAAGGGQELAISVGSENPSGEGFYALNSKEEGSLFLLGEKW